MKKKVLSLMVTLALLAGLTGCGSNDVIVDIVTNDGVEETEAANESEKADKEAKTEAKEETNETADTNPAGCKTIALSDIKVGVLYIGSSEDTSGYTYAHEIGIQGMVSNLGMKDNQVCRKDNIDDNDEKAVTKALDECIEDGCNVINTSSMNHI